MLVTELLSKLESYKREVNEITDQYNPAYYEDCEVYFGSLMWSDCYEGEANPNNHSYDQIRENMRKVDVIVAKADALLKDHNLTQLLLEGTAAYWLGILPDPYTSVY